MLALQDGTLLPNSPKMSSGLEVHFDRPSSPRMEVVIRIDGTDEISDEIFTLTFGPKYVGAGVSSSHGYCPTNHLSLYVRWGQL